MANRVFDFGRRVVTTASTLFGRPWGIPRPQDGTGTAPQAPSPNLNPISPKSPYVPPFQLKDDPPPEASRTQREEEYAAAQVGLAAYYRSLPMWIDDLTRGLGDDLYARMGLDDQVFSSTRNLVRQVLADGLTIRPAVDDRDDPLYEAAREAADRAEAMLGDLSAGLPQSMDVILQEALLIAMGMGHKVFELVYEPAEDGWTDLARVKSKPRRSTAFVVNPYNDLVGMLVRLPGMALPALASVTDLRSMPILPLDKFAVLTHLMEDSDPRGNSLWRAAYARWWEKLQVARDYMRYLGQFAMPSLAGEMPPTNTDEPATDIYGNPGSGSGISQAQAFVNQLVAFRNGSAMAHPNGAKVYTVFAASTGEAFWAALDRCDRQIDKVISGQVLASQEALHGTRAQSKTHQDTAGHNLPYYRGLLEDWLNRQILRRWLRLNLGPEAARVLCPKATLTKVEEQDKGEMMRDFSTGYTAGLVKPSQLPFVHEQLGLPPALPEELTPPTEGALALAQAKGGQEKNGKGGERGGEDDAEFAADPTGAPDEALWQAVLAVLPDDAPDELPHFCGEVEGVSVWLVDGDGVKIRHDMDMVEGGNDLELKGRYGSSYIPEGCVWVDASIHPKDWPFIAYHELHERRDMAGGVKYDRAHARANAGEKALRLRAAEGKG